ncbi:MmcQ/YjbR family DNA-binding protein [Granulicella sp. S190]|uniref:MmcQ/YjbR family DNA-binding protein n=1 Tax=Granulicella sp. S190 TaxID=1747226 RepID=UPI00131B5BAA|nr:MmcQ/YjbR family DNA-binding protein [Granulicella sp. S190]
MDIERIRAYLLTLPHVVETAQWGGLVFWVGDKAIGGKMFVMLPLDENESLERSEKARVISYLVGAERYSELLEAEGIFPAPYVARIFWVAVAGWDVFRKAEWERELSGAHALTLAKLPPKVRAVLDMPAAQQKKMIVERRKLLAAKTAKEG